MLDLKGGEVRNEDNRLCAILNLDMCGEMQAQIIYPSGTIVYLDEDDLYLIAKTYADGETLKKHREVR